MRRNKIHRLPPELRDAINERFDLGYTVAEITDWLKELGAEVSRSGVGRYRKEWVQVEADIREARMFADATMRSLRNMPEDKMSSLITQQLEQGLIAVLSAMRGAYRDDPEKALKMLVRAATAHSLVNRASKDHAQKTIKVDEYAETRGAQEALDAGEHKIEVAFVEAGKQESAGGNRPL